MLQNDLLLVVLLVAVLVGAALFVWWDIIAPRRRQRMRRAGSEAARGRARIRFRVAMDLWGVRKTRRLTDQRRRNSKADEQD